MTDTPATSTAPSPPENTPDEVANPATNPPIGQSTDRPQDTTPKTESGNLTERQEVNATPRSEKTAIGSGNDPRGGYVVGFSDGTVRLVNVPDQLTGDPPQSKAAEPWGRAPEGEYTHFFVDSGTGRYGFVNTNGEIEQIDNPVTHTA